MAVPLDPQKKLPRLADSALGTASTLMKIAITGATGNVGTALLRRLAADGADELVGISRRPPPRIAPYASASWHAVDLSRQDTRADLLSAFDGVEAVVHAAWAIQPSHDRELLRATNQGGTMAVVSAARAAGVRHLVHLSSIGAYAAAPGQWKDEGWSTSGVPASSYSVDKAACESMLDKVDDLLVTRVRPALIFQPFAASEVSRYFIGTLVPLALLRPEVLRFAPLPPDLAVQCVHANDVADALVRILRSGIGGAFNLATEPVLDRSQFATVVGGVGPPAPPAVLRPIMDLAWRAHLQPTDPGWLDLAMSVPLMRTERARDVLGWAPTQPLTETLRDFLDALRRGAGGVGPVLYPRRPKTT